VPATLAPGLTRPGDLGNEAPSEAAIEAIPGDRFRRRPTSVPRLRVDASIHRRRPPLKRGATGAFPTIRLVIAVGTKRSPGERHMPRLSRPRSGGAAFVRRRLLFHEGGPRGGTDGSRTRLRDEQECLSSLQANQRLDTQRPIRGFALGRRSSSRRLASRRATLGGRARRQDRQAPPRRRALRASCPPRP
jgi:hypothetical protein